MTLSSECIPLRATETSQLCCKGIKARPGVLWDLNITFKYFLFVKRVNSNVRSLYLKLFRTKVDIKSVISRQGTIAMLVCAIRVSVSVSPSTSDLVSTVITRSLCNCLAIKVNHGTDIFTHKLNCLPPLLASYLVQCVLKHYVRD